MQRLTIWMCRDLRDSAQSGFARSKRQAEEYVATNRGYTDPSVCATEGWCEPAVQIEVPEPVASTLIKHCLFN